MHTRLALVIGNADYENIPSLENPINDASSVQERLDTLGFNVTFKVNRDRDEILIAIENFVKTFDKDTSDIVFYYAGHGRSIAGENYLVPTSGSPSLDPIFAKNSFVSFEWILEVMEEKRISTKTPIIAIIDCCRTELEAYERKSASRDIKNNGVNMYIMYATSLTQVSDDNSIFTQRLVKYMGFDQSIEQTFKAIQRDLKGAQIAWVSSSLDHDYSFLSGVKSKEVTSGVRDPFYGVLPRNLNFVGREDLLEQIRNLLKECRPLVLSGLGGMGKTQLMTEYCYRQRKNYRYVFWMKADGRAAAAGSFRKLAQNLGLGIFPKSNDETIYEQVRIYLERESGWLLLLDNVDSVMAKDIFQHLPRFGGDIILTTREYISLDEAEVIPVSTITEEEALQLLHCPLIDQSPQAREIVIELGCMPLAINLARSYINDTMISFQDYLNIIKKRRSDINIFSYQDNENSEKYNQTVATVWQPSFDGIKKRSPTAAKILEICAFLHPDSIPMSLFEQQHSVLGFKLAESNNKSYFQIFKWLKCFKGEHPPNTIRSALVLLKKYSFLTPTSVSRERNKDVETDTLRFHRAFQKVLYDSMTAAKKFYWAQKVATTLNNETKKFSNNYDTRTHAVMNVYLQHIHYFISLLGDLGKKSLKSEDLYMLIDRAVSYQLSNGMYFYVENLAKTNILVSKAVYGIKHPKVADSLDNLAMFYFRSGNYKESKSLYAQALTIREEAFGPEDYVTATSLDQLGDLCCSLSEFDTAESCYQRALTIKQKVRGPDHPDTATSLNNLAVLYKRQCRHDEAKELHQQALYIRESKLGLEHPDTATSLNNLAGLNKAQGNYAAAEPLYQRALSIRQKVLSRNHDLTAACQKSLASIYMVQGKYNEAEPLYRQSLEILESHFRWHPDKAYYLIDLAELYLIRGKEDEAEELYQQALEVREKFGSEHDIILLNIRARLCSRNGKYNDAVQLYQRVLEINEKVLGTEHPKTAESLDNLALLYFKWGKYDKIESLYQRALTIREKVLGKEHPDTASSLNNLAEFLVDQKVFSKAEQLFKRALVIREKTLIPEHPDTAATLNSMASLYDITGKYNEAEPLYRQALEIVEKVLGTDHPKTALIREKLTLIEERFSISAKVTIITA